MMMSPDHSISNWISLLKQGDLDAAQNLWQRYSFKLVKLARHRLRAIPRGMVDEDDIAQSVFLAVCRGADDGRFQDVRNRDDLWWLLLTITQRKIVNLIRKETTLKRGSGHVRPESDCQNWNERSGRFSLDQVLSSEPSPEFIVLMEEQTRRLLGLLRRRSTEKSRAIAAGRLLGCGIVAKSGRHHAARSNASCSSSEPFGRRN